jgi:hypothetical protein
MTNTDRAWRRQGEEFWRAHHEAWKRSDLNQRQYCEAQGLPRKAFENWRAKFRAEPQPPRAQAALPPSVRKSSPKSSRKSSSKSDDLSFLAAGWPDSAASA